MAQYSRNGDGIRNTHPFTTVNGMQCRKTHSVDTTEIKKTIEGILCGICVYTGFKLEKESFLAGEYSKERLKTITTEIV